MTKSTITREHLQEMLEWCEVFRRHPRLDDIAEAIRMALAAMDSEPVFTLQVSQAGYKGQKLGNHFGFITLDAARELDEGNYQLYRHAQQPVVRPAPECQHQWRHGGANKLQNQKQCIKCGRVELDAQQPVVQDERAAFNAWNNDVDCHLAGRDAKSAAWLAWQARAKLVGNSPVIPGAEQRIADAVELLKQAAPAMLADNSGPDGPLAGRMKSPVIPEGSVDMLRRWLAFGRGMQNAGSQLPHNLIAETESMLAAAPQEVKGE